MKLAAKMGLVKLGSFQGIDGPSWHFASKGDLTINRKKNQLGVYSLTVLCRAWQ